MGVWLKDEKTGIECGISNQGELFLGDKNSGYNLPDTHNNRIKLIYDFYRNIDKGEVKIHERRCN